MDLDRETAVVLERFGFDEQLFESLRVAWQPGELSSESNLIRGSIEPDVGDVTRLPPLARPAMTSCGGGPRRCAGARSPRSCSPVDGHALRRRGQSRADGRRRHELPRGQARADRGARARGGDERAGRAHDELRHGCGDSRARRTRTRRAARLQPVRVAAARRGRRALPRRERSAVALRPRAR